GAFGGLAHRGDRRAGAAGMLLLAGGAGAPGDRVRHTVPAGQARRALPAGPRPGAARRRPVAGVVSVPDFKQFPLADTAEGLTEAEILNWHVKPGDEVQVNQIVVEVETAKAAVELPIPWAGVITELLVSTGETVEVGTPILTIDVDPAGSSNGT